MRGEGNLCDFMLFAGSLLILPALVAVSWMLKRDPEPEILPPFRETSRVRQPPNRTRSQSPTPTRGYNFVFEPGACPKTIGEENLPRIPAVLRDGDTRRLDRSRPILTQAIEKYGVGSQGPTHSEYAVLLSYFNRHYSRISQNHRAAIGTPRVFNFAQSVYTGAFLLEEGSCINLFTLSMNTVKLLRRVTKKLILTKFLLLKLNLFLTLVIKRHQDAEKLHSVVRIFWLALNLLSFSQLRVVVERISFSVLKKFVATL